MSDKYDRTRLMRRGNPYDGYTYSSYVSSRKMDRLVSLNGKSPRVGGKLRLRANVYNISTHVAVYYPYRKFTYSREVIPSTPEDIIYYYYEEGWSQDRPGINQWYDPSLHYNPNNLALSKLWDEIEGINANLAVLFAERQSAIDMIADKATKIFQALRDVKRGKPGKAMQRLGISGRQQPRSKQASGQWLELQYGWLPLVGDIYNLAGLDPFAGDTVSGRANVTTQVKYTNGIVTCKHKCEHGMTVVCSDPALAYASQLGLTNPAIIAWELTPFSFVIDWFLPIGDYISRLTQDIGFDFKDYYVSNKIEYLIDRPPRKAFIGSSSTYDISEGCTGVVKEFTRSTPEDVPKPELEFKNPLSPMHLANAVALGRQLKKE